MEEENKKEKEGASFSMQVKEELSNVEGASRHCQLAELAALVLCVDDWLIRKWMMMTIIVALIKRYFLSQKMKQF